MLPLNVIQKNVPLLCFHYYRCECGYQVSLLVGLELFGLSDLDLCVGIGYYYRQGEVQGSGFGFGYGSIHNFIHFRIYSRKP